MNIQMNIVSTKSIYKSNILSTSFIIRLYHHQQQQQQKRFVTTINIFVIFRFEHHLLWTCSAFGVSLSETSVCPDFALSLRNDVGLGDLVRWSSCSILSPALHWNEFDFQLISTYFLLAVQYKAFAQRNLDSY